MAELRVLSLLAVVFGRPCEAQIAPDYAQNVTVYHLNPASAGAVPLNMDTGDARGDLYFYLGQFLLPLECKNASKEGRAHFDCDNPERVDPNLVVTKVELETDSRTTAYSACNLCNGTDPFSHKPCEVGSYVCDCFGKYSSKGGKCDPRRVGNESIKDHFAPHVTKPSCASALQKYCGKVKASPRACPFCVYMHKKDLDAASCGEEDLYGFCPSKWGHCSATSPEWMCWSENIPRKTEGYWYSTLAAGLCNETSAPGSCGWKVLSTRTVQEKCLKNRIMSRVESSSPSCFSSCGPRDTNSSCWISCFFDALLGRQARHSLSAPLGGLPIAEVEKAWAGSFLPEAEGGCPSQTIPDYWTPPLEEAVII